MQWYYTIVICADDCAAFEAESWQLISFVFGRYAHRSPDGMLIEVESGAEIWLANWMVVGRFSYHKLDVKNNTSRALTGSPPQVLPVPQLSPKIKLLSAP